MARKGISKVTPVGTALRHLNKQTFLADSSTVLGESIPNPAYREAADARYLGMLVTSIRVYPKFSAPITGFAAAASFLWQSQLQTGEQSAVPAIMDLDDEFLFAAAMLYSDMRTAVGFVIRQIFPIELEPVKATPIIVTPEFTVIHDAGVNDANFASKEVHTVIEYQIVEVPDRLFTQMLMNQSRTS